MEVLCFPYRWVLWQKTKKPFFVFLEEQRSAQSFSFYSPMPPSGLLARCIRTHSLDSCKATLWQSPSSATALSVIYFSPPFLSAALKRQCDCYPNRIGGSAFFSSSI